MLGVTAVQSFSGGKCCQSSFSIKLFILVKDMALAVQDMFHHLLSYFHGIFPFTESFLIDYAPLKNQTFFLMLYGIYYPETIS